MGWHLLVKEENNISVENRILNIKHKNITDFNSIKALHKGISLHFSHCNFEEPFILDSGTFNYIRFHQCNLHTIQFNGGQYNKIEFEETNVLDKLVFFKCIVDTKISIINEYDDHSYTLENLYICDSFDLEVYKYRIANLDVSEFSLEKENKWHFSGLHLDEWYIDKFQNYGSIVFDGLEVYDISSQRKLINFKDSDLGTMNFMSCDFEKFNLSIDNCKIINIFYTNTRFPYSIKSKSFGVHKKKSLHQQQDTYDQLETVARKNGQLTKALDWRAKSNDAFLSSLLIDTKKHNIQDIINLGISKFISNYGQSWTKPLIAIVTIGLLFFPGLVIAADPNISFGITDWISFKTAFTKHFGSFFEFLIPIHRTNFLGIDRTEMDSYNWYIFLDVFGRILISYPLYQFIRATRKFASK